ncbi:MAG: NAD(P)-dependent oxidoreductase [Clostridia bacterium]|nr:NAD(P)-dependent oxidoreductase [Clostridia bacterium]
MRRVVITGATSFIGSAVSRVLLDRGCQVYALVRPESAARKMLPTHPNFHEVTCDLADTKKWVGDIGSADVFFHFAWEGPGANGRADPDLQKKNVRLAVGCMHGAAELKAKRFLFSGSQAEYGAVFDRIMPEELPCHPVLEYGKGKVAVCQEATELMPRLGIEYVHMRFFSVYGPNDHPYTLVPSCIRCFLKGETIPLSECKNKWNFLHVEDAAEAAVRLAECKLESPVTIVNVAGTDTRRLKDFVEEIHRLAGGRGECAYGARHSTERPVDNWPDISRLQRLTGWSPRVTFEQGISGLIAMEREEMDGGKNR